jgi:hypothetical protein
MIIPQNKSMLILEYQAVRSAIIKIKVERIIKGRFKLLLTSKRVTPPKSIDAG